MFFTEEIANIVCVGVLAQHRGKGYGSAAVWQSIRNARNAGCRYVVLHATAMGLPVYQRMGFQTYFQQPFYMPTPPAGAG